jgi:hypothetical protein
MTATAFLVFYRFKAMNKEETEKSKDEWNGLKNGLSPLWIISCFGQEMSCLFL